MWIETSIEVYSAIVLHHGRYLSLHESFTDMMGQHGRPTILTVWGLKDADAPLIKILDTKQSVEQKSWDEKYFIWYHKNEAL